MSPSRGFSSKRQSLLLAIATVTVLHLIVYRSTSSLRSLHRQQLSQQLSPLSKRDTEHEPETDALINWLSIYNHTSPQHKPLVFTLMIVWLIFLFAFVGICASEFFCPNLSHIASRLGLSESVAGVTFLAFSNGSPDVFSTFSALKSNAGSLAIGELIGAASFIVSVVAGTMALITPFKVSPHTFLRDVGFFTLAVLLTLAILFDSHIHLWEALLMVGLYTVYVAYVAVGGWWWDRRERKKGREKKAREEYDHTSQGVDEEGRLLEDEEEYEEDEVRATIRGGAEIEWEREEETDDEGDLIHLPVSGSTTPRSTTGRSITSAFSSNSIIYHPQSQSQRQRSSITPPPVVSPRLPRPHSHHSHFRSRSTSLINPISSSNRPAPTPLSLQNSISSLSSPAGVATTSTSTSGAVSRKSVRPSLLGAIEFRDLVNSLNQDKNNANNLLSVFTPGGTEGKSQKKKGKNSGGGVKRPGHSRSSTNTSISTNGWGTSPEPDANGASEWNWNGWGGNTTSFEGANRRRASSSPGFRPEVGGLKLAGEDDLLARGVLAGPAGGGSITSSSEEEDNNPWVQEAEEEARRRRREIKKVPSILLTSENGSDTLLPTTIEPPTLVSSSSASTSSLTVRPNGTNPSNSNSSPLSTSHLPPSPSTSPNYYDSSHQSHSNRLILSRAILASLFPSLSQFRQKSIIGKLTALMCVPALLVLNLTLPVAEEVTEEELNCEGNWWDQEGEEKEENGNGVPKGIRLPDDEDDGSLLLQPSDEHDHNGESSERVGKRLHSPAIAHPHSHHLSTSFTSTSAATATAIGDLLGDSEEVATPLAIEEPVTSPWLEQDQEESSTTSHHFRIASTESDGTVNRVISSSSDDDTTIQNVREEEETESLILDRLECLAARKVTRGLTAVQCTLGPVFCAFALFADELKWYQPVVALLIGLFFATLSYRFFHNPRHPGRVSLCFVGFAIAMVWILMIVNEVVGVLQTLGHIFGISDAILGLTIFAMGNSLGDLVANATVARMGYPSMAIAACFGGPMLNILLGVGLSGTYLIALSPSHEPIHVEMGRTLVVSGVGLFLILVGSLIVVPLNGFRMTKRIGGFLIGAYTIVLTMNVITEIWW